MLNRAKSFGVEGATQARHDHAADQRGIAKPHLGLGGMDVDVDFQRRNVEEKSDDRVAVPRQHVGIGAAQGAIQ